MFITYTINAPSEVFCFAVDAMKLLIKRQLMVMRMMMMC